MVLWWIAERRGMGLINEHREGIDTEDRAEQELKEKAV